MNGSNKILTVSYGTFSCTLEGFEDPFNSMRSIAEYFRDLAADDRYFGAEPPTPDVEMLQALAERESRNRIEARASETGISLRVTDQAKSDETGPLTKDDEFMTSDEPEDALVFDQEDEAVPEKVSDETIAEKLKRIRAVVSRSTEPVAEIEPMEFDAPVEPRSRALTQTLSDIAADIAGDDEDEDGFRTNASEDVEAVEEILDEDDAAPSEEDLADLRALDEPAQEAAADDEEVASEDVDAPSVADFAEAFDAAQDEDSDEAGETNAFSSIEERAAPEDENAFSDKDEVDQPEVAAEVEGADDVSDEGDFPEDDGMGVSRVMAVLSGKADDVPAEAEDKFEDEDAENAAIPPEQQRRESRMLGPIEDEGDDHVGRLMDETEGKFAEDDGVRRRRVISQMRAAVAATRADRILSRVSTNRDQTQAENPYRRDLDRVVTANREKAPLMLVSELRVDEETGDDEPDALPSDISMPGQDEAFTRFASEMGASELPELLEAAAAYSAFVEGQPHFSRPDIMKRVAGFAPEIHLSREAGLRSFGQLLREGKIRKLQRGQFTIDKETRFNPAHRIAGE